MSDESKPVTKLVTPIKISYTFTPGTASLPFLHAIKQGKIIGAACDECGRVYVPPRGACARCAAPTGKQVELAHQGTVITYCVVRVPSENIEVELPYCAANILLDGADITLMGLIQGLPLEKVRIGMRVEAVWRPESEWDYTLANIKHFEPIDEPDVPFEQIKEYS